MKEKNEYYYANADFWKRKLMAFLHDPPCKAIDFSSVHEDIAWNFCLAAGLTEDDKEVFKGIKDSDRTASSADRFPFPTGKSSQFTGLSGNTFIHPLGGNEFVINGILQSTGEYEGMLQDAFGGIKGDWKEKFFLYWRLWMENAITTRNKYCVHLALMPAETRIPDHTIWTHLSLTSAIEASRNPQTKELDPAFLIFQAGPVQEFIAQARSTRDLWSGSYMLSWLTGHAIKAITDELGPDVIIFPSLRGVGIFDILNKDIYEKITYRGEYEGQEREESLWYRLYNEDCMEREKSAEVLLNPSLPNRFFALVPFAEADRLAHKAEESFRNALKEISEHCWERFKAEAVELLGDATSIDNWKQRWDKQVELFPQIVWSYIKVEKDINKILDRIEKLPACMQSSQNEQTILTILRRLKDIAEREEGGIPVEERDPRYYKDEEKRQLNSWAFAWGANYALAEYTLAARRNTRDFQQFYTDENQSVSPKDTLTGKEEIIGNEELWKLIKYKAEKEEREGRSYFFRTNEGPYGAISIIKRLWCRGENNYLFCRMGIDEHIFNKVISADSVEDIAKENDKTHSPYVAVIAMDGDQMGKWVSGEKAPELLKQFSKKMREYFGTFEAVKGLRRPLTPAYHLQFSEALSNFANFLAGKIVKHYNGQLIYAGGDDVLAMAPADYALECAQSLRAAFRGKSDELPGSERKYEFASLHDGFVNSDKNYPLIVPGPAADVSCGIAIAHFKYPLQRMVKEAQKAEKRAKNEYNRSAFSISLLKRGGEILYWGAKWDSEAPELFHYYIACSNKNEEEISSRFPYALAQFLAPYKLANSKFEKDFYPYDVKKRT